MNLTDPPGQSARQPKTFSRTGIVLAGVAASALVNWLVAKASERRHPPMGRFVSVRGVRLHYIDLGPRNAALPPVVMVHGNGVTAHEFVDSGLVKMVARERRVIVFDRPGAGYSERPRATMWTVRKQARILADALIEIGVDRPIVVGHSFGTLVALALALQTHAALTGLVLISGYYFPTVRPEVPLFMMQSLPVIGDLYRYTIAPLLGWIFAGPMVRKTFAPSPVPRGFDAFPLSLSLRPSQLRAIGADTALMVPGAFELSRHYAEIHANVAIIAGAADQIVDVEQSRRLHGVIENSQLNVVPGAGHMVHHLHPMLVAAAIDWVDAANTVGSANARDESAGAASVSHALRIRERAHQLWCSSDQPAGSFANFRTVAAGELEREDAAYDKTVADSFPASDPPAHSGITKP